MAIPREPEHLYKCPRCGATVPESELNTPEGVASCDKCQLRLGRSGNTVTILAQIDDDDLCPELTAQEWRDEMDRGFVVSRLRDKGGKAFADPTVCQAIRRTDGYADMLKVVAKHASALEQTEKEKVADALQGAYLLDEETIPEGKIIGNWVPPTRLRQSVQWAKCQHPKFVTRSKKFLRALDSYRSFAEKFKALERGPEPILAAIKQLEGEIRAEMAQVPRLYGTPLKDFQKSPPHVLAEVRVVPILRSSKTLPKSDTTSTGAADLCKLMLFDAGLMPRKQDSDAEDRFPGSVKQNLYRSRRRPSH